MLIDLLDLPERALITIAGAGGKTTTMYTLAREFAQRGQRVITTTTTNIYFPEKGQTDAFVIADKPATMLRTVQAIPPRYQRVTVVAHVTAAGKLAGLQPDQPYTLLAKTDAAAVIVEADGARGRLIKAPDAHEPVIPPQSNAVLLVMSAAAINQPLSPAIAHRPERIAALLDIKQGDSLTPERIARLITDRQGGMKAIPGQAAIFLLITQATDDRMDHVRELHTLLPAESPIARVLCSAAPDSWCVCP